MNVIVGMASVARFVLQSEVKGTANSSVMKKNRNYAKLLNCLEKDRNVVCFFTVAD